MRSPEEAALGQTLRIAESKRYRAKLFPFAVLNFV